MASNTYTKNSIISGQPGALTDIDGGILNEGDKAIVVTENSFYVYRLAALSGADINSPGVIAPSSNAELKRWILVSNAFVGGWYGDLGSAVDAILFTLNGNITADKLYQDLSARIDLIDSPSVGLVDRLSTLNGYVDPTATYTDKTYMLNELTIYGGYIYKCIQAIESTPGPLPTDTDYWLLVGEFASLNGAVTAYTEAVNVISSTVTNHEGSIDALTSTTNFLTASVGTNTSVINAELLVRASEDEALATSITALDTRVGDNEGSISNELIVRANADSALADSVDTLTTSVDGHTTSIQTQATSINGIEGKYTVKIDNNGYVSGYGLISTNNNGSPTSEFIILAETFKIVTPGDSPTVPFAVGNVGGASVVGINAALIIDGSLNYDALDTSITDLFGGEGQLIVWYYAYVPTLFNVPYTDWISPDVRDDHEGDMFVNTLTGKQYYFKVASGSVYSWENIQDEDISLAISDAATAQDTADHKRRVFVTQPTGPYDIGDLWTANDIVKHAKSARTSGYLASEWTTDADKTSQNTANDTAFVNGTIAGTVVMGAANGNTAKTKVDSWDHSSNTTLIDGGKIYTNSITATQINADGITIDDLDTSDVDGTIAFSSTGRITFTDSNNYIYGSSAGIFLKSTVAAGTSSISIKQTGGIDLTSTYSLASITVSSGYRFTVTAKRAVTIDADEDIVLDSGTGHTTYFKFAGSSRITLTSGGLTPATTDSFSIGSTTRYLHKLYCNSIYKGGGILLDTMDDLAVMAEFKPWKKKSAGEEIEVVQHDPKTGYELIDPHSMPDAMVNKDEVRQRLRDDCGCMITEADIEEWILIYDEAGWMIGVDMSMSIELASGAVRQMDRENKEMYELIFSRFTSAEIENKELKNRVKVLEDIVNTLVTEINTLKETN